MNRNKLGLSQLKAWECLVTTHSRLLGKIERQMDLNSPIPLHWYDVLLVLNRSKEKRARLSDIADQIITSRSALTRSVEKLEKAGLLKKIRCEDDKRGQFAEITPEGQKALKQSWKHYRDLIHNEFGKLLSQKESHDLIYLLSKLKRN